MKKRILSLILALAMLCALLPQAALPASASIISGYCGAEGDGSNLIWTLDTESGLLTIEGSGAMSDYDHLSPIAPWYYYRNSITAISLPEGLTRIGNTAFCNCDALTNVTIPGNVTEIGDKSFGWIYTSSIYGYERVNDFTIYGYSGSTAQTYAKENGFTFVSLGDLIFTGTCGAEGDGSNLTWTLNMNSGLLTIEGSGAMASYEQHGSKWGNHWNKITAVSLPEGLSNIGSYAFNYCTKLTSITIPDSVTSIGIGAFDTCLSLTSASLGNNVTNIGGSVFANCKKLETVSLSENLTSISQSAFIYCNSLKSITIPNSVKSIEMTAFMNCTSLESVTFGNSVTTIHGYAFDDCISLTSVVIPDSVKSISTSAFYGCKALTNVTIGSGLKSIEYGVFAHCTSLLSVTIPANVTSINYYSFDGCTSLKTIYGYSGTFAQTYANNKGLAFVPLDNAVGEFVDVTPTDYFADPVLWAINHEPAITAGVGVHSFGPHNDCTREQIVTFLWAANGKPEPAGTGSTFSDVATDAWYYKPVMWAVENGYTSGMGDGSFGVGQACTRAQAMTFLWAAQGKPTPSSMESPFGDVSSGDWFCKAILWAAENGITKGVGNGLFGVNDTCTRAQIITFLYKAYN